MQYAHIFAYVSFSYILSANNFKKYEYIFYMDVFSI